MWSISVFSDPYPAGNYMFEVNNRNFRTRSETCSKLTIKTAGRRQWQWRCSGVLIVNFERTSHLKAGWVFWYIVRSVFSRQHCSSK